MKIIFGGGIVAARGSIGGNVYSANASGAYVRAFAMPTNPDTAAQQAVRATFGSISNAWKGLSQANQNSWIEAAPNFPVQDSLGQTVILTGQQLFCRLNNSLQQIGESGLTTAPSPGSLTDLASLTIGTWDDTNLISSATTDGGGTTVPTGQVVVVEATAGLSAGINAPKRPAFKKIGTIAASASLTSYDATTAYAAKFGSRSVGTKVFLRMTMVLIATGQRGQSFQIGAAITAA